jgi:hypothetical protein
MKSRNRYKYGSAESISTKLVIKLIMTLILLPFLAISGALDNKQEAQTETSQPTRTIRALDQ